MKRREDIRAGVSSILHDLRVRQNISKAKMAKKLGVDDHTWNSWESGRTAPSVVDFIYIYQICGESILHPILDLLYPEEYSTESVHLRTQLTQFINNVATDHQIDILSYIAYGKHGSLFSAQTELFCAYNHLPMEQRFIIAEMVYTSFLIANNRGDLIERDETMPDVPTWENGLRQAQRAAYKRLQSYTDITEE